MTAARTLFHVPASGGHTRLHRKIGEQAVPPAGERGLTADGRVLDLDGHDAMLHPLVELPERLGPTVFMAEDDGFPTEAMSGGTHPAHLTFRRLDGWSVGDARRFALECAERVLPILTWHAPDDDRPNRLLEVGRAIIDGRLSQSAREGARRDARAYESDMAEHACHPAILPAAKACTATVRACAWGAVRVAATCAADAEATRAAWEAAWSAARDAAWFACTAAASDAASASAWHAAWSDAYERARHWQAVRLAQHLGIAR